MPVGFVFFVNLSKDSVILFKLCDRSAIRIMYKVKAIAARCNVAEYFVSLLVFEDQVFVKLFLFDLTRLGRHELDG